MVVDEVAAAGLKRPGGEERTGGVTVGRGLGDSSAAPVDEAVVRRFLLRWAETTDRRLRAAHPRRPAWDANRRRLFVEQLLGDCPGLSERQRMAVLATFDRAAERAVIRGVPGLPSLSLPGRVAALIARLDVGSILDGE
jgi:hypothetical protein